MNYQDKGWIGSVDEYRAARLYYTPLLFPERSSEISTAQSHRTILFEFYKLDSTSFHVLKLLLTNYSHHDNTTWQYPISSNYNYIWPEKQLAILNQEENKISVDNQPFLISPTKSLMRTSEFHRLLKNRRDSRKIVDTSTSNLCPTSSHSKAGLTTDASTLQLNRKIIYLYVSGLSNHYPAVVYYVKNDKLLTFNFSLVLLDLYLKPKPKL